MKAKKILLILIAIALTISLNAQQTGTFKDTRDGHTYKWVKIGNQTWMAENLNYKTAYGSWCYDDKESNCNTYGRLYNWETAKKVCPDGWHLPSSAEWRTLIYYLGESMVAGGKMKETGTIHWNSPNTGATNESGFSALPGGRRYINLGYFISLNQWAEFWSSSKDGNTQAWFIQLTYKYKGAYRQSTNFGYGLSIRCIKN